MKKNEAFDILLKKIGRDNLIKALSHKYLKREGVKGNYKYIYKEEVNNGKESRSHIDRFSQEEEQGRNYGNGRNAEATDLIRGSERASSRSTPKSERCKLQEEILIEYAKKNKIWYNNFLFKRKGFLDSGVESEVFLENKHVVKVNNLKLHGNEPLEYLDRLAIHNYLFPETPCEVVGFTKVGQGLFAVIVKQPFVKKEKGVVSDKELEKYMLSLGFTKNNENKDRKYDFKNNEYLIEDLHPGNVFKTKSGELMFIDPLIYKIK